MATAEQIKKTILKVAGNPESGIVKDLAQKWADEIVSLDNPTESKGAPETNGLTVEKRVVEAVEIR